MLGFIVYIVLFLISNSVIQAQKDTLEYKSDVVLIESATVFSDSYMNNLLVTKVYINDSWQKSDNLSEVLSMQPGLSIKDYGGIGGMKTVSIRGTSSNQTTFMLDGMRINPSQNGIADLNILPMSLIDNIEIIRGGASALFGSNAIGGVVNLNTSFPRSEKYYMNLMFREFNDKIYSTGFTKVSNDLAFSIDLNYIDSKGEYPFKYTFFSDEFERKRTNSDFEKLTISPLIQVKGNDSYYSFRTIFNRSWQGVPGAVLSGHVESAEARLDKNELIFLQKYDYMISEDELLDVGLLLNYNSYNFRDLNLKNFGSSGLQTEFTNLDISSKMSYSSVLFDMNNRISTEFNYSHLSGDQLDPTTEDKVNRTSVSLSDVIEKDFDDISILTGARYDHYFDMGSAVSPFLSLNYSEEVYQLGFQYSYNFRPPSFNEMYYLNYGTADLKPERSHSLNFGVDLVPIDNLKFTWNMYLIRTKNQIIAVPISPVSWRAANAAEVRNFGVEFTLICNDIFDGVDINFSYTRQDVRDVSEKSDNNLNLVAYIPQELISSLISYNTERININLVAKYSSFRYSLADNSIESVIPDYLIGDAKLGYKFNLWDYNINLYAFVDNILDKEYSIVLNYPMPGRYFGLGVNFEIKENNE